MDRKILGESHADLAYDFTCLGEAQLALGRRVQAMRLLEAAHALREKVDIDPFDRGRTLFALARALPNNGKHRARGRQLAERAHRILAAAKPQSAAAMRKRVRT